MRRRAVRFSRELYIEQDAPLRLPRRFHGVVKDGPGSVVKLRCTYPRQQRWRRHPRAKGRGDNLLGEPRRRFAGRSQALRPALRRSERRFGLCADSVTLSPTPGSAECARLDPYPSRRMRSNLGAEWSASTLHLDVAAVPHRQRKVRGMLKLIATAVVAETAHQLQRQLRLSSASCARHRLGGRTQKKVGPRVRFGRKGKRFHKANQSIWLYRAMMLTAVIGGVSGHYRGLRGRRQGRAVSGVAIYWNPPLGQTQQEAHHPMQPRRKMRSPPMKLVGRGRGRARGKDTRASLGTRSRWRSADQARVVS